jgi:hypothetical protein
MEAIAAESSYLIMKNDRFWNKVWKLSRCWRMSKIILMFTVPPSLEIFGINVNFVFSVSGTYPNQSVLD